MRRCLVITILKLSLVASLTVAEPIGQSKTTPIETGQRVFSAGHSFHNFVPYHLRWLAASAKIKGHVQLGTQRIGGSFVHQHWDRSDETNTAKQALKTGKVDLLTLSPIYLPDEGIEKFSRLAMETNPRTRVTIQEFWLPFDVYDENYQKKRPTAVDRNARTSKQMREIHAPYFANMDAHVRALNKKLGRQVLFVVPAGQAAILLREKIIAGKAPGLDKQDDLFGDAIGHATVPLQILVSYCHYAVIYRRSPVGLVRISKSPNTKAATGEITAELDEVLQELAWQAVREHPLSGVE